MQDTFDSLEDIKAAIEKNYGILSIPMEVLRDAYGVKKLGIRVREDIAEKLQEMNLGHIPEDLPDRQNEWIRLYLIRSPAEELIRAVLKPGKEEDNRLLQALGWIKILSNSTDNDR